MYAKIRSDLTEGQCYGELKATWAMATAAGRVVKLTQVDIESGRISILGYTYVWSPEMFEGFLSCFETWESFARGDFAVKCRTEDEFIQFMTMLHCKGIPHTTGGKSPLDFIDNSSYPRSVWFEGTYTNAGTCSSRPAIPFQREMLSW